MNEPNKNILTYKNNVDLVIYNDNYEGDMTVYLRTPQIMFEASIHDQLSGRCISVNPNEHLRYIIKKEHIDNNGTLTYNSIKFVNVKNIQKY